MFFIGICFLFDDYFLYFGSMEVAFVVYIYSEAFSFTVFLACFVKYYGNFFPLTIYVVQTEVFPMLVGDEWVHNNVSVILWADTYQP